MAIAQRGCKSHDESGLNDSLYATKIACPEGHAIFLLSIDFEESLKGIQRDFGSN